MLVQHFNQTALIHSQHALKRAMSRAESEVNKLKRVTGIEEDDLLEELDWETSITFCNGLRVPPWQQNEGILGFIIANTKDNNRMYIMAHLNGFWQVKGPDEQHHMDSTQIGNSYSSLNDLLRAKSPYFDEHIDSANFSRKRPVIEEEDDSSIASTKNTISTDTKDMVQRRTSRSWLQEV